MFNLRTRSSSSLRKPTVKRQYEKHFNSIVTSIYILPSNYAFTQLELIVNMALRAESSSSSNSSSSSHLVGIPVFWQEAAANPTMEWDKWLDLFQVAMMAKYSIYITELTREANQQNPRVRTLMGDLEEDPANKNVISVMYLSLGEAARKQFKDKYPHPALWELEAQELITMCNDCFHKKGNRTLDRHRFFSRLQKPGETTLFQFWHALNGLAAICDFGDITTTLVLDMFILHMSKKCAGEALH